MLLSCLLVQHDRLAVFLKNHKPYHFKDGLDVIRIDRRRKVSVNGLFLLVLNRIKRVFARPLHWYSIALSQKGKLRNQVVFNVGYGARIAMKVATVALYVNGVYFLLE